MIKIGIYSNDSTQKKDIKKSMLQYFEVLNIESEIRYIRWCNVRLTKQNI